MPTDLPYNECYAVIEAVKRTDHISGDYAFINIQVRNPMHSEFRSNFDLEMKWYFSGTFHYPYGGDINAVASSFSLNNLLDATKTMKKVHKKYNSLHGNTDVKNSILNFLKACKVTEVRIHNLGEEFHGWNHCERIDKLKDVVPVLRDMVNRCSAYSGVAI